MPREVTHGGSRAALSTTGRVASTLRVVVGTVSVDECGRAVATYARVVMRVLVVALCLAVARVSLAAPPVAAPATSPTQVAVPDPGRTGTPRRAVETFLSAARDGDFEQAG